MYLKQKLNEAAKAEKVRLLFDYMKTHGDEHYEEEVTQMEHALQTAFLAKKRGHDQHLITAALFHDIGHMLAEEIQGTNNPTLKDDRHEEMAAGFFQNIFPDAVIDPIRLHVEAKRYLCTVEKDYYEGLSEASKKSFHLQGGPMSADEKAAFERQPYYKQAVQLRLWDDEGKELGKTIPPIESYQKEVEDALL